jgi:formylglycine-generating enzyme required for sulfatase activity
MVWVPGGTLQLGDSVYREELPVRNVAVQGFWMDRTEVTNAQFAAFVQATGYVTVAEQAVDAKAHPELAPDLRLPGAVVFISPNDLVGGGNPAQWRRYLPGANWRHPGGQPTSIQGRELFPVVNLTYRDALAYAQWARRTLPSEAQWEWAARGAAAPSETEHAQPAQANTWQGLFPVRNLAEDGFVGLAPVGCYAPNALGLFDMLGNVWEITRDRYTASHAVLAQEAPEAEVDTAAIARRKPGTPGQVPSHVIKGGSFLCAPNYCMRYRAGARQAQEDDLAVSHLGFRTILQAPGP